MKNLLSACAPLALILPQVAVAQDFITLDEIVLSATLAPQAINRTGATVDVIDNAALVNAPVSVSGAIARVAGTSVSAKGGVGGLTGEGIGRIEIVKGSQSALYGSEAVAGVVDIRTFELDEDGSKTRVGLEAGSFGTVVGSVGHAIKNGETALSFNLSKVKTDGFSARASDEEADGFSQTLLTVKGQTEVGNGIIIGGSAL